MKAANGRLFGPVPSRRFSSSLGVDLNTLKTCSMNCIFCQLGRTTRKTIERKEYVPLEPVLDELGRWLADGGSADYITLSGSGEPTLHTRFGEVLDFVKRESDIRAALLTNGSMLSLPEVREAACRADVVKVSLSAWSQESMNYINRPHPQLDFGRMLEGIKKFRNEFSGELWLEVFLVWGVNTTQGEAGRIATLAREIRPDKIHLNTSVRPPAEEFALPLPVERMEEMAELFEPRAEIATDMGGRRDRKFDANEEDIFNMLRRRPCTADQTAEAFGMHLNEVAKYFGKLTRSGRVHTEQRNGELYYTAGR